MPKAVPASKISPLVLILIAVVILLIITIIWRFFFFDDINKQTITSIGNPPQAKACSSDPLPEGKRTFLFSHGSSVLGPKPTQAVINTLIPKKSEKQIISLAIKNPTPVIKATAILEIDDPTKAITQQMTLSSGTTTNGVWTTSWLIPGSYDCFYQIKFLIQSGDKKEDVYQGSIRLR